MNELLNNCLSVLKADLEVLNTLETNQIESIITKKVNFGDHGIDWSFYPDKISLLNPTDVLTKVKSTSCYIMWDEGTLPIIRTDLNLILTNLNKVLKVAFDTWVIDTNFNWVLEFHHSGVINYTNIR